MGIALPYPEMEFLPNLGHGEVIYASSLPSLAQSIVIGNRSDEIEVGFNAETNPMTDMQVSQSNQGTNFVSSIKLTINLRVMF